ncbi:MAG: beta strand repeat-containing protein [Tepidisphaerales bacterium]
MSAVVLASSVVMPSLASGQVVSWVLEGDGQWTTPANWSTGQLPGPSNDVVIDRPSGNYLVTLSSGNQSIRDLTLFERLQISSFSTLTLGGTANIHNTLTLSDGTLSGGTVVIQPGGSLVFSPFVFGNRLAGVSVVGDVNLSSFGGRLRWGVGTTASGVVSLTGGNNEVGFEGSSASFGGTLALISGGSRIGPTASNTTLTLTPTSVVRGGPGSLEKTYGGTFYANFTVVNQGLISADVSGQTLVVSPTTLTNQGVLEAKSGGTLTISATQWSNSGGVIRVNNGTVNLEGSFDLSGLNGAIDRTGGTINLRGTANNVGNTFVLNASTGVVTLSDGTISGGTVVIQPGGGLAFAPGVFNSRLAGVSVVGDVNLSGSSQRLRWGVGTTVSGVVSLNGVNAELGFEGTSQSFDGLLALTGNGSRIGPTASNTTLTLTVTSVVRGGGSTIGASYGGTFYANFTVVNQGLISADVSGQTLVVSPTTLTNEGVLEVKDGGMLLIQPATFSNLAGTVLTGGTYRVGNNSAIRFNNQTITELNARLILDGPTSAVLRNTAGPETALQLSSVGAGGALVLSGGRTASFGALSVGGELSVQGGTSQLAVSSLQMLPGAAMSVGVGGTAVPVVVSGTAQVDGTLEVSFAGGSGPATGVIYTVLTAGSRVGTFSSVQGTTGSLTYGEWRVSYTATQVRAFLALVPGKGDFNFDGLLDAQDIDVFIDALLEGDPYDSFIAANASIYFQQYDEVLTQAGVVFLGDFDANGQFDAEDIDPFVAALLQAGGRPGASVIPEPALLGMLAPVSLLAVRRRR